MARRGKITRLLHYAGIAALCAACMACLAALSGCFVVNATLANTQSTSLAGISSISVSYPTENITFFASDSDELVLKEYISESDESYHGTVTQSGSGLSVKCGARPDNLASFSSYVEIYIPVSWEGSLHVTTSSGMVSIKPHLRLRSLTLNTGSGSISIANVSAGQITLSASSGRIAVQAAEGEMFCSTSSGGIDISSFSGSGTFSSETGKVSVSMKTATGDVSIETKSGKASLVVPQALSFAYEATSKSGHATTNFDDLVATSTVVSTQAIDYGKYTQYTATVGDFPSIGVSITTSSGAISVTRTK